MSLTEHRFAGDRLMVIIPDRLSDLVRKGEVTERYYNPGELFREVHIVMLNDDKLDPAAVQPMVGGAKLHLHNLIESRRKFFLQTLGWQFPLIEPLLRRASDLAGKIQPQLVRTHNNFLEGVVARRLKQTFGIPYVVSLHGVWDVDDRSSVMGRVSAVFRRKLELATLAEADAVIAVYGPIIRYAQDYGAERVELIYNVVAGANIPRKTTYDLQRPPHLVTINRQVPEKNPENIIRAVATLECNYTIIGDGPLHEGLRALAAELGCEDRVNFVKAVPNAQLCAQLPTYDMLVSHCDYWGMSKTIIEAGLTGLPIIINRHPEIEIEEYAGGWIMQCENSTDGYRAAIETLLDSADRRKTAGDAAASIARDRFDPEIMELRTVSLYREMLAKTA